MPIRGVGAVVLASAWLVAPSMGTAKDPASADRTAAAPGSYQATILKATERLRAGDASAGLALATHAAEREPRAPPGHIVKGMALFMLGRATEAGPEFSRGLHLTADATERRAYVETIVTTTQVFKTSEESEMFARALDSLKNRRLEDAVQLLTGALKLNPSNPRVWGELGYVQVELGRLDAAVRSLEAGRQINPASEPLLQELHHCYHALRRFRLLRQVIADEIMIGGNEKALLQDMAVSYAAEHNAKDAIPVLEGINRKYPDFAPPYYTLGQVYQDLVQDRRRAKDYFQLFLRKAVAGGGAMDGVTPTEARELVESAKTIVVK